MKGKEKQKNTKEKNQEKLKAQKNSRCTRANKKLTENLLVLFSVYASSAITSGASQVGKETGKKRKITQEKNKKRKKQGTSERKLLECLRSTSALSSSPLSSLPLYSPVSRSPPPTSPPLLSSLSYLTCSVCALLFERLNEQRHRNTKVRNFRNHTITTVRITEGR